ncbi:MAG: hypothetical protein HUU35_03835 [Armatimonadetes bacterium]|nr:hypothetical protein [Armatimonadota bacterium]
MRLSSSIIALLACLSTSLVSAQNPPVTTTTSESRPSRRLVTVTNQYLRMDMRVPEVLRNIATGTPPFSNFRGGRVALTALAGDPFTTADDGAAILQGAWLSYAAIRVGLPSTGTGTSTARLYEAESLYRLINDPGQDFVLSPPTAGRDSISFSWLIREDHPSVASITPASSILTTTGGLAGSASAPLILVQQTYRLVRDMVRMDVELTNQSTSDLTVATALFADPQFGGSINDGQEFFVGDVREGLDREFRFPSTTATDEAGLRQIPETWRTFDDQTNPGVVLGGVWDNDDIRNGANSAGVPTETMFVSTDLAGAEPFDYTPVNLNLIDDDWAVMARWLNVRLSPNQTKRFTMYFGLAGATSDFDSPYVLSLEAPHSLALSTGDDPSTAVTEAADNVFLGPNPFQVRAFVQNTSSQPINNLAVSLALPEGLSLTSGTATRTIATIPAGTEQQVIWTVQADNDQRGGVRTITVSTSASGVRSKVVEREIGIPALPRLEFPSITSRLDMISIPYDFQNRDVEHILGSLGNIGVTGGGNAAVARYNPSTRSYAFFPDPFITSIQPGEGFWLFNGSLADLVLPSDRQEVDPNTRVGVALRPDWNQIGCPYTVPTRLFDTEVITSDNAVRTFSAAVNAGIVRPVLYEYSPDPNDPSEPGQYTFSGDSNTLFNPWRGYWLRVLQDVTLVYTASSLIGPYRSNAADFLALRNGWEIGLRAEMGDERSQTVMLGQDAASRDTYDSRDVDAPPTPGGSGVRMMVGHGDWGRDNGYYLRDIRSAGRTARWEVLTETAAPNQDVTLRWNLRGAPADVQFTLVDLSTGLRRHMRTTSAYVYNSGPFGQGRVFQVLAERRGRATLAIPSMVATPGRGHTVNVSFTLTTAATVEVLIESPTGRRVRTLATGYAGTEGQNVLGWDGRDDERRPVPAGQYRCRVLVHTPDGQQAIAERIVVLNR